MTSTAIFLAIQLLSEKRKFLICLSTFVRDRKGPVLSDKPEVVFLLRILKIYRRMEESLIGLEELAAKEK